MEELEELYEKTKKAIDEINTIETKVETLLDEEDMSSLQSSLEELEKDLKLEKLLLNPRKFFVKKLN